MRIAGAAVMVYDCYLTVMDSYFYDNDDTGSSGDILAYSPRSSTCDLASGSSSQVSGLTCTVQASSPTPSPSVRKTCLCPYTPFAYAMEGVHGCLCLP